MSNRSEPTRKFVQTFVLAEQPGGYFVLNDIIRFLAEDEEEYEEEAPVTETQVTEPVAETTTESVEESTEAVAEPEATEESVPEAQETAAKEVDDEAAIEKVDQKLEEAAKEEITTEAVSEADTTADAEPEVAEPAVEKVAEANGTSPEKPAEPEPTPAASPKPASAPVPVKEAAPAKPKTWAALLGNRVATPAIPVTPVTPIVPAPAAAPAAPAVTTTSTAVQPKETANTDAPAAGNETGRSSPASNSGWQTASGKHQSRQQSNTTAKDAKTTVSAYIKNVTERVDAPTLRQALSAYGKIEYLDLSRPRNCAFVEFADQAGYNAAAAASPIQVGSEQVTVEERRRNNNFNQGNFAPNRNTGRGRENQGRGGFQNNAGRGGFGNRNRGGNVAGKGRSQAQAA